MRCNDCQREGAVKASDHFGMLEPLCPTCENVREEFLSNANAQNLAWALDRIYAIRGENHVNR